MKILAFAFLLLHSLSAFSYEEVWKLGDHFLPMEKNEAKNILISKMCINGKCEAMVALKKVSMKQIPAESFSGGKNPGAVACTESVKGKIIYLKDLNGNENTFCAFEDKSMVSTNTLTIYARQNDKGNK